MPDRWFRVPTETIERTDGDGNVVTSTDGPKYRQREEIKGFTGNTIGSSPQWVVRFYGTDTALDGIAAETDAKELTASEAAQRFGEATDQSNIPDITWDATTVKESFWIGNG